MRVVLHLKLLGGFDASLASGRAVAIPARKAQALLAYVSLRPGLRHSREKIASLLWGNVDEQHARTSLRHAIFDLRRLLPVAYLPLLRSDAAGLVIDPGAIDVDVARFERQAAQGTASALTEAATLYRGPLLDGFALNEPAFEEWLTAERERLRALAVDVLGRFLSLQGNASTETVIQAALKLLAIEPLNEGAHRTLMRTYARQGRRSAAIRQYRLFADLLLRDLGMAPEQETRALYQDLLAREAVSPAAATSRTTSARGRAEPPAQTPAAIPVPARQEAEASSPFIGRDVELAAVARALDEATRGKGMIAVIRGEAGIGKTRFVQEAALRARQRNIRVLLGRCYELERLIPFRPWADALRSSATRPSASELTGLRPQLRAELARLVPGWEAEAGSVPPEPPDYLRLFEAVAQFLTTLARVRPVLLILEDLHWADEMSLRLLAFLSRSIHESRMLVLITARDEDLVDNPTLGRLLREIDIDSRSLSAPLSPLSRGQTEELVRLILRHHGSAEFARLAGEVWSLSAGNPFVIVETVRALNEHTVASPGGVLPLAKPIREVTSSRLESLGEPARDLVAIASVVGGEFSVPLLAKATAISEPTVGRIVEDLVRRGLLADRAGVLEFAHERIRQVAYARIVPARRTVLHRVIAKAIEELYGTMLDAFYAKLAAHYQCGELWEEAAEYFRRAGAHALRRSAAREATACFAEALACLSRLPTPLANARLEIDLRFDIRHPLVILGEYDSALAHLSSAEEQATQLADQRRVGRARAYLAHYHYVKGQPEKSLSHALDALHIGEALGDIDLQLTAKCFAGQTHHVTGNYRAARHFLDGVVSSVRGANSPKPAHTFHARIASVWLVWTLAELGEFDSAQRVADEGLRSAAGVGDVYAEALMCLAIGLLHLRRGMPKYAVEPLLRGIAITRARDFHAEEASIASALGLAYGRTGRTAEALQLLEGAVERASVMSIGAYLALRIVWLGEVALRAGHRDVAADHAIRALNLAQHHKERGHEAFALKLLGDAAVAAGDPCTAAVWFQECVAAAESLHMSPLVADARAALAQLPSH